MRELEVCFFFFSFLRKRFVERENSFVVKNIDFDRIYVFFSPYFCELENRVISHKIEPFEQSSERK